MREREGLLERVEQALRRAVVLGLVLLAVSQWMLANDQARILLSYLDRGEAWTLPALTGLAAGSRQPELWLTIEVVGRSSARKAEVLVNGVGASRFQTNRVRFRVKRGDLIEVDCTGYQDRLSFRVTGVSSGITHPVLGQEVTSENGIARFGLVDSGGD
ncbi:MAG: hypothetical protein AB1331_07930 [Bacillota bacterium]